MEEIEKISVVLIDADAQSATSIHRKLDAAHESVFEVKTYPRLRPEEISGTLRPDAVILNLASFNGTGLSVFESTLKVTQCASVPILLLTNAYGESIARELMRKGAQDYLLSEEITPKLLDRTISYLVKLSRKRMTPQGNDSYYRMLVENSPDIITVVDKKGNIVFENPAIEKVFGYKPQELLGQSIFDYVHYEEKIQVMEKFEESMSTGVLSERIEFRFRTKGGQWRVIEVNGSTVLDANNQNPVAILSSRDVTDRVKTEKELFSMTIDDPLTGLLNRRGFMILSVQQLKLSKRTKQGSCLIYADVDGLKSINDNYGHAAGDEVIMEIAHILKDSFRDPDIIARLSGDEFAVLAIGAQEIHAASLIARVKQKLERRNQELSLPYPLSMSMGVVYVDSRLDPSIENILAQADFLMYQNKKNKQKAA